MGRRSRSSSSSSSSSASSKSSSSKKGTASGGGGAVDDVRSPANSPPNVEHEEDVKSPSGSPPPRRSEARTTVSAVEKPKDTSEQPSRSPIRAPSASPPSHRRERSRSKSRSRSGDRHRSRSPPRRTEEKSGDRRERSRSRDRNRGEERRRSRSRDRRRSRSRDRGDERRRDDRDRGRDRERDKDRERGSGRRLEGRVRRGDDERREDRGRRREISPLRGRSPKRARRDDDEKDKEKEAEKPAKEKKEPVDLLRTRAGGAYIPPAKLKMMQDQIADKSSEQYQRMNWERLKKKVHGQVNKVNVGNLVSVVREMLQENIIRGKGLLARSIIQAQAFSPTFSHVYAALVAVINSKFPEIGDLILKRLVVQFKRSFRRSDKAVTVTVSKFIAHLINQQVAHEVLALEIMILMLDNPTDDSVEVTIAFLKECGAKLQEIAPRALDSVFARLRSILQEADIDKRVKYMIEVAFHIRKDKFKAYPAVIDELDLIEEDDQIVHTISLDETVDPENSLNVFHLDPDFEEHEARYDEIRKEIIGDAGDSSDESEEEEEGDEDEGEEGEGGQPKSTTETTTEIVDMSEQTLVAFRREVYLTIQSSLDYQEAAHKLLKLNVKPQLENELLHMMVDCCAQQRTYERFYGLLIERFCRLRKEFQDTFEQIARDTYLTIHRFDLTKLRNMARLISHLLFTDAIDWTVMSDVKLTEKDTTSSGRIYLKYIFQELCEQMGIVKLYERIRDPTLQTAFAGIFPRDDPSNARFAINFFTLIGLGGLTVDLREFLEKGAKKKKEPKKEMTEVESDDDDSSSSSSDSDSSDSSDSDSSSSSSDSDDDDKKKKHKKQEKKKKKAEKKGKEEDKEARKGVTEKVKEEIPSPAGSPPRRGFGGGERRGGADRSPDRRGGRGGGQERSPLRRRVDSPPQRRRRSPSPPRGGADRRRRSPSPVRGRRESPERRGRPARSPSLEKDKRERSPDRETKPRSRLARSPSPIRKGRRDRSGSPPETRRRRSVSRDKENTRRGGERRRRSPS